MNITKDIIADLLPTYYSGECSHDTKSLVEEYLKANPDFERQAKYISRDPLQGPIPQRLAKKDEMRSLEKTKKLLRLRSSIMALAIFFSIAPFSFFNVDGRTHWMLLESPVDASFYGAVGICMWVVYFVMRQRMRVL